MTSQNNRRMFVGDGILYHRDEVCVHQVKHMCVPYGRPMQVMCLAHAAVVDGHLGNQKTSDRIRLNFFWSYVKHDILSYTSSCQPCKFRTRAKRTDKVPITPI